MGCMPIAWATLGEYMWKVLESHVYHMNEGDIICSLQTMVSAALISSLEPGEAGCFQLARDLVDCGEAVLSTAQHWNPVAKNLTQMGMGQNHSKPLIPPWGWLTSIYQLFWCSPGFCHSCSSIFSRIRRNVSTAQGLGLKHPVFWWCVDPKDWDVHSFTLLLFDILRRNRRDAFCWDVEWQCASFWCFDAVKMRFARSFSIGK